MMQVQIPGLAGEDQISQVSILCHRHGNNMCLNSSAWGRGRRPNLCSISPEGTTVLPDLAHGAHGQKRRDMEAFGFSGLCSSPGTVDNTLHWVSCSHVQFFCDVHGGEGYQ